MMLEQCHIHAKNLNLNLTTKWLLNKWKEDHSETWLPPHLWEYLPFTWSDWYVPFYKTLKFWRAGTTWLWFWTPRSFHSIRHQLIFDEWMTSPSFQGMAAGGHSTKNQFKAIYKAREVGFWTVSMWGVWVTQRSDPPFLSRVCNSAVSLGFGPKTFFAENSLSREAK